MGSFSVEFADKSARQKNLTYDKPFKLLIPAHLGGGCIKDSGYQDYGNVGQDAHGNPLYDWHELIAIMNKDVKVADITDKLKKRIEDAENSETMKALKNIRKMIEILSAKCDCQININDAKCIPEWNSWLNSRTPREKTLMASYEHRNMSLNNFCTAIECRIAEEYNKHVACPREKAYIYSDKLRENPDLTIGDLLRGSLSFPKTIDNDTDFNRSVGIEFACYETMHKMLPYPLKIVHARYNGTYEQCNGFSASDPEQGFYCTYFTKAEMEEWKHNN